MTLHKHVNGDIIDADETNQDNEEAYTMLGLNVIRGLIDRAGVWSAGTIDGWGDAYTSASGREGSVVSATATFDTNKFKPYEETIYVVIEASSLGGLSNFEINDCNIAPFDTGKWVVWCDTGSDEVKRAQIIKTLFYGSNGTDGALLGASGVTALKTTDSRDVGKRAHYKYVYDVVDDTSMDYSTGTFADTSTNTDSSIWRYLYVAGDSGGSGKDGIVQLEFPNGTSIGSLNGNSGGTQTSDGFGTDSSSYEQDNPADVEIGISHSTNSGPTILASMCRTLILCSGALTWVDDRSFTTSTEIDFFTDYSIPVFTAVTSGEVYSVITHKIPAKTFSSTMSSVIGVPLIEDWEDGADIQYKLEYPSVFVTIEATSISAETDFLINDCNITEVSSGKWLLVASGTEAEQRAKIYKTLFFGSDGSDPRASSTYITGITALNTSVSRDVGKGGHLATFSLSAVNKTYTGTFANTTTNTYCSSWSNLQTSGGGYAYWEIPDGTIVHSTSSSDNEIGTNTEQDELDNPADCQIHVNNGSTTYNYVVILCVGTISWVASGGTGTNIDFTVDNSIPVFTAESGYSSSSTDWLDTMDTRPEISSITTATVEPINLLVKLIPKTSSPTTGYPSIRGFWIRAT